MCSDWLDIGPFRHSSRDMYTSHIKITLLPPSGSLTLNSTHGFTLRSVPGHVPGDRLIWLQVKYR
jgi:hypothetical protein